MLTELCQELRNWFEREKYYDTFTITDGVISVPDLQDGQFFRVIGSVFNDGVHKYGDNDLTDEVFTGAVWSMAIPPVVVDLSERISEWKTTYADLVSSPYQSMSESFGDYSRSWSKGSGQGNANSSSTPTWQSMFANELNRWRKI